MENDIVTSKIERPEVWCIAVLVTLLTWIVAFVLVTTFWDQLCAKIAITALEYGAEQMVSETVFYATPTDAIPEVRYYRPSPPNIPTLAEQAEDLKAWFDRMHPSETVDEALERLDRQIRKTDTWPFYEFIDDE